MIAEGDPWIIYIKIKDFDVQFKIDTGSDVTIMPDHVFLKVTKPLFGPGCSPLNLIRVSTLLL